MLVKHEKINLTSVSVRRLGKLSIVSMECVDFEEAGCARTEPMRGYVEKETLVTKLDTIKL